MLIKLLIFCLVTLSFFSNIFLENNFENKNIEEISYSTLIKLKNITKINVFNNEQAHIYTNNTKLNNLPEFYFIVNNNNNNIFQNYTISSDIDVYYKKQKISYFNIILSNLPNILITLLIIKILLYQINQLQNVNKKINISKNIKTKFSDVAGLNEVKQEVKEFVDILKQKKKFKEMGCKVPRGALFFGSPGTGKTLIAKAIAGECESSFIHVAGSGFNEKYVGVGQSRIKKLFEKARQNTPCIIFIDEIDTLGTKRTYKSSHNEQENTLNCLLAEMDGIEDNLNVMIFAATNRPELLDSALLRSGRFDRKIQFNLPTLQERKEILNLYLKKYKIDKSITTKQKNVILKMTIGLSGADISNLCNESAITAVRNNHDKIKLEDFNLAYDYIAVGQKKKSEKLNFNDKKYVSYHESGHAFMSYIQKHVQSPIKVSIIPTTKGALGFSMSIEKEENLKTSKQIYQQMAVILGGRCSEELFMSDITTGASNDLMKLREVCKKYIVEYGFISKFKNNYINENMENISDNTKYEIDKNIQKLINEVTIYTLKILKNNEKKIIKLANCLYKKEELNNSELKKILGRDIESTL